MEKNIELKIVNNINKVIKKKRVSSFYSKKATIEYLEDMARKGWLLDKVRGRNFYFREIEPCKIRYDMVIDYEKEGELNEISMHSEESNDSIVNQWHYVDDYQNVYYFYTTSDDIPYIENDKEKVITKVKNNFRKIEYRPLMFVIAIWLWFSLADITMLFNKPFEINRFIDDLGINICLLLVYGTTLICYYVRYKKFMALNNENDSKLMYIEDKLDNRLYWCYTISSFVLCILWMIAVIIIDKARVKTVLIVVAICIGFYFSI